ncbi:MAG: ATP-binding protein [bacterium]|nr:ATP-binding protein [bacterium]
MPKTRQRKPLQQVHTGISSNQSSEWLEAVLDSIGDGMIATDEKGIITKVNNAALDILGREEKDLLGMHFPSTIVALHENGAPIDIYNRPITKAFMAGKTISERIFYLGHDNRLIPVTITISPIIKEGRPIGAVEVFHDLTAEIEQEKLKSDFISIASHQLRTPLSAINMYTRMLQEGMAGELTANQEVFTKIVLTSVERMNELIDTLLNITRIEAGSIVLKERALSFDNVLKEIVTEFKASAEAKSIVLKVDIEKNIPELVSDSLLLKEVCSNLISNALKYTPEGGDVNVRLGKGRNTVKLSVKDSGYGIPDTDKERIFTKFFRASNISNRDVSGTGLGLYLTKIIAEKLGGELSFKSRENIGTTFEFCLPIK